MSVLVNGRRLGVAVNGQFTAANTDPIPAGKLWTEAAASWNAMRAAALLDGIPASHFVPGGPASSARSIGQQEYFWAHRPPPAAYPGTSNHGWAIAVDIPFADAQAWLRAHGAKWGWSHDEGARVGEAWHFRMVRPYRAPKSWLSRVPKDEARWIREYDRLKRANRDRDRRVVLRRVMTERRKLVWHAAQKSGWSKLQRRKRYNALKARTA